MSILARIQSPEDVKALSVEELPILAQELRERIISTTSRNGGHVGPNLGVVELTIGLHRVFNTPKDRFVFDVAHQGYVHKPLTGRNDERFDKLRLNDGLSGFRIAAKASTMPLARVTLALPCPQHSAWRAHATNAAATNTW